MAPNENRNHSTDSIPKTNEVTSEIPNAPQPIKPINVFGLVCIHLLALYGVYVAATSTKVATLVWTLFLSLASGLSITGGAHRLWSHRSYKAKWQLEIILMLLFSMTGQNTIYDWVRDHRVHHKFSETDADPHNAKRGFWFSHVGWLMMRKHPEVYRKGKMVDMSDMDRNPYVQFQKKYFIPIVSVTWFLIPVAVPCYFWGEGFLQAFLVPFMMRFVYIINLAFSVNSFAHIWGNKPYDRRIGPTDNLKVSFATLGEGWHNYHHSFPWDYKAGEFGSKDFNLTTALLNFFAKIGWAYDMKTVSPDIIKAKVLRTGDGSHHVWGYGDKDMNEDEWVHEKNL